MARIDTALLERLGEKTGLAKAALYRKIQGAQNKYGLERPEAALALAADLNLNINRFSSAEQRRAVAGARGSRHTPVVDAGPNDLKVSARAGSRRAASARPKGKANSVFVVLGRNKKIAAALIQYLRALQLHPVEWEVARQKTHKPNPYIGEILRKGFEMAAAVVVLMTPDDLARLKDEFLGPDDDDSEKRLTGQPRPNVLFEAGYAFGLYPANTVLVQVGKLRGLSDIHGLHIARMDGSAAKRKSLAHRLKDAGLDVHMEGDAWLSEGDFSLPPT